jgi:uncharacterized protein (TIGR02147 family)
MLNIFEFDSYKEFLRSWLQEQPNAGHGLRSRMAEAIGTQTGFITQVLTGSAHFSPEQVFGLAELFGQSPVEIQFLQLLLSYERAGTVSYRKHLAAQIEKVRTERNDLRKRLKVESFPSEIDQGMYFSSWLYACVHVMATCERFQNSRAAMAEALHLSLAQINEILEFLFRTGLVEETPNGLRVGNSRVHLGTDSPFLRRHHTNLNLLSLQNILNQPLDQNLQYSSLVSLSKDDVQKVREIFLKSIQESKGIVRDSEGDTVFATTINFFKVA